MKKDDIDNLHFCRIKCYCCKKI